MAALSGKWRLPAAGLVLLLAAGGLLLTTKWDAAIDQDRPPPSFAAGPLFPGEAFEQQFDSPVAYLSRVEIAVQSVDSSGPKPAFELIFRLYEGERIVRQGIVNVPDAGIEERRVLWEFTPVAESAGKRFKLQVVVGQGAVGGLLTMATLRDFLPGALVTNGIPTAEHIDLWLIGGRRIGPLGVIRVVTDATVGSAYLLPALLVVSGVIFGSGLRILRMPSGASAVWTWALFGIGVSASLFELLVRAYSGVSAAETLQSFRLGLGGLGLALALTPWAIYLTGSLSGAISVWRDSTAPARLLAAAITLSVAGLLTLIFTALPPERLALEVLDDGRPFSGRFPLLTQAVGSTVFRYAIVLWAVYGAWSLAEQLLQRVRFKLR